MTYVSHTACIDEQWRSRLMLGRVRSTPYPRRLPCRPSKEIAEVRLIAMTFLEIQSILLLPAHEWHTV
jgi:hypothetical protein